MRSSVVLVVLVVAAVAAQVATASTRASTRASTPRLVVVDRTPLTIVGRGFPAINDVTLIIRAPKVSERRAFRSDSAGRFRVVIRGVSLTGSLRCGVGVAITARIRGDGLVLWHQTLPNCPAPLRPPADQTS